MRTAAIPFKLDLKELLAGARRQIASRAGDVTLNLPFVSFAVSPKDTERRVAREVVIRLRDRRVLSAWECCDDCIDKALASLQEVRRELTDAQVQLVDMTDGPLFLIPDAMLLGIRQFMTFEQHLRGTPDTPGSSRDLRREAGARQDYFDGLELLRGHLSRCLGQVASVAGLPSLSEGLFAHYQGPWQLEAYTTVEVAEPHEVHPALVVTTAPSDRT